MPPFTLLTGLGATAGLWLASLQAPPGRRARHTAWAALVLLGALVGARAAYAAFHPAQFNTQPVAVLRLADGGLSWPGGLLGGLMVVALAALAWRKSLALTADALLAPLLAPLSAGVWLGCWPAGCAYGPALPAGSPWAIQAPDEFGLVASRFPLQMLAALIIIAFGAALQRQSAHFSRPGRHASLSLLGISAIQVIFTFLRADARPTAYGLALDTWAAFGLLMLTWLLVLADGWLSVVRNS